MSKKKNFDYQLTESDLDTLLVTLSVMLDVLPDYDSEEFDEDTKIQALSFGEQALLHLSTSYPRVQRNELIAIHISLGLADMINQNEIIVDPTYKKQCSEHLFSINHLLSVFDSFFE